MSWTPTSLEEMEGILEEELQSCSVAERDAYACIKAALEKVPIVRCGSLESVIKIASYKDWVLVFEDIEQGFEWCRPDIDGVIREYSCGQSGLQAALYDYMQGVKEG